MSLFVVGAWEVVDAKGRRLIHGMRDACERFAKGRRGAKVRKVPQFELVSPAGEIAARGPQEEFLRAAAAVRPGFKVRKART